MFKNSNEGLKKIKIILGLMFGYALLYMDKNMISTAIIPIAQNLNLKEVHTGAIMSSFFLGYSLMQIPSGILADKLGPKKMLILSLFFISIFTYLFGISGSLIFLMISRLFSGIGHGGYPPSCAKAISQSFSIEERTFIQSLILSTIGIGGILAFSIGARILAINWHNAYLFLGTLYLIALIFIWRFIPNSEKIKNNNKENKKQNLEIIKVFKNKNTILLFIAMFLINVLLYGIISWNPSFIKSKFNLPIQTIGIMLILNSLSTFITTNLLGKLLSKVFLKKEKQFLLSVGILSAIFIYFFINSTTIPIATITLILSYMFGNAAFICLFTWPHKIMDENSIGSAIAIINTGGTLGGFFAPMLFGWLITITEGSFTSSFVVMAIAGIATGIITLFIDNKKNKELKNNV